MSSLKITYFSEEPNYAEYELQITECAADVYCSEFLFSCQEIPWTIKDLTDLMYHIVEYDGSEKFIKIYHEKYAANVLVILSPATENPGISLSNSASNK